MVTEITKLLSTKCLLLPSLESSPFPKKFSSYLGMTGDKNLEQKKSLPYTLGWLLYKRIMKHLSWGGLTADFACWGRENVSKKNEK